MYKVIICEDEAIIRKGIVFTTDWEKLDCIVVEEAENGQEALEKIEKIKPDIIITDINMPLVSGLEMLEGLQSLNPTVIILSGYDDFKYAQKAMSLGAVEYLLKPVQSSEFEKAIEHAKSVVLSKQSIEVVSILPNVDRNNRFVDEVVQYVFDHFKEKIVLKDIANYLGYSVTYTNNKFKEATGCTINDYINKVRIQKAVDEMMNGNRYIYELAIDFGFSDYKYFALVFKKMVGCSPKEFMSRYK